MRKICLVLLLLFAGHVPADAEWDGFEGYYYKCDPANNEVSVKVHGFGQGSQEETEFENKMVEKYHLNKTFLDKNYIYSDKGRRLMAEKENVLTVGGGKNSQPNENYSASEYDRVCKLPGGTIKIRLNLASRITGDCTEIETGGIDVWVGGKLVYQNIMNSCSQESSLAAVVIKNNVLSEYNQETEKEFQHRPLGTDKWTKGAVYEINRLPDLSKNKAK